MRILLLNQCFYPDVVATGQHLTDLAVALAKRGHDVTVVTSFRGYDDPAKRFSKREKWRGITIIRLPCTGFGKGRAWRRALDFGSFLISVAIRLFFLPGFDVVVAMTSPPFISFLFSIRTRLTGEKLFCWMMDLNPDEAIEFGWLKKGSLAAKFFEWILRSGLDRAEKIVVLDRWMKDRLDGKGIPYEKTVIIPPWSHNDVVSFNLEGRIEFRKQHGLTEKHVVMYSGNHSPCHPLDTLLEAAKSLRDHPKLFFVFIGGGSGFKKVQDFLKDNNLQNVLFLPYQPLDRLSWSLSAADTHVVVMGDRFVGIVHPCKIYNILTVGIPFLFIGPPQCHIADIVAQLDPRMAQRVGHGDVEGVVRFLSDPSDRSDLSNISGKLPKDLAVQFSNEKLLSEWMKLLEDPQSNLRAPPEISNF